MAPRRPQYNDSDLKKLLTPAARAIANRQTLGVLLPYMNASKMSSNQQIIKDNPEINLQTTKKTPVQIGSGFLAEDKRELNSDETEFALENFARGGTGAKDPRTYMNKEDFQDFLNTYNMPKSKYGTPSDKNLVNQAYVPVDASGVEKANKESAKLLSPPNKNGASDTKMEDFSAYGGLKAFMPDATKMYDAMYGVSEEEQTKQDNIRFGMNMLTFFTQMGAEASKPGATALGAANIAGANTAQQYLKQIETDKAREDKRKSGVIDLASKLATFNASKTPKTGKQNVFMGSPATNKDGTPKLNADGEQLYNYIRQDAAGKVLENYLDTKKASGTTVNIGDKDAETFGKKRIGGVFKQFEKFQEGSDTAIKNRGTVNNLLSMVTNPDFESGWDVNFKTKAREIGKALGFKINEEALSSAQAFRAASFELVLGSVEQMKGALSDKELDFLKAMNPSLLLNKDTNKILLLTMKHTLDKAAGFNAHVRDWEAKNGTMTTVKSYNKMMDEFKAQPINQQNPKDYITSLAEQEEVNLIISKGGKVDDNGDYIPNSLTPNKELEIKNLLENKFSLSLLDKTFKNYFKDGQNAYPEYQRQKVKIKGKP
tara:strand:- start:2167 stop:3966 length:1800 start_codon:yes stop_codon:yes gene_type:complete